ncbi:MAG: acyltransferase [Microbacterium sp.]
METVRGSTRLSSLDGLRGVAALIVVVHHSLLVSPALAAAYYGGEIEGTLHRLAVYTPLHLLWGGKEAVVVFFVLSGLVLVMAMRSRSFDWFSYFPSRLVRLYLPVAGAVAVGALIMAIPSGSGPDSPWLQRESGYPLASVLQDLTLVGGNSHVITPLWTLRWEIIFSLLLPVAAYSLRLIPAWAFGAVSIALSVLGASQGVDALRYLPIFGLGVALAGEWDRIGRAIDRVPRRAAALAWPVVFALSLLLLSSYWMLKAYLGYVAAVTIAQGPILVGAVVLIVAAAHWRPLERLLSWRWIALLGAISFSLYLVHEPIVLLVAHLSDSARLTLLIAVPASLVFAWMFWLVVERPAHALARRVREHARGGSSDALPTPGRHVADARTRPVPVPHDARAR